MFTQRMDWTPPPRARKDANTTKIRLWFGHTYITWHWFNVCWSLACGHQVCNPSCTAFTESHNAILAYFDTERLGIIAAQSVHAPCPVCIHLYVF